MNPFPHNAKELTAAINTLREAPIRLPDITETVAITLTKYKMGALFFDRVWCSPCMEDAPPSEVRVWGGTATEMWPGLAVLALAPLSPRAFQILGPSAAALPISWEHKATSVKYTCDALFSAHKLKAVPIYESADACSTDYGVGETETIVTVIENLGIINEGGLNWQQVMDFRNDRDAKMKLRRMRLWLDSVLVGKPLSYVTDAIAIKLDDYEWALKKHGIETITGSLSGLLDFRFLSGTSAAIAGLAVAGGPSWAAIGTAGLLLGRVTLSVTTKLLDLKDRKRGRGHEVAFISELKKLAPQ
jgi:hypothetical protein